MRAGRPAQLAEQDRGATGAVHLHRALAQPAPLAPRIRADAPANFKRRQIDSNRPATPARCTRVTDRRRNWVRAPCLVSGPVQAVLPVSTSKSHSKFITHGAAMSLTRSGARMTATEPRQGDVHRAMPQDACLRAGVQGVNSSHQERSGPPTPAPAVRRSAGPQRAPRAGMTRPGVAAGGRLPSKRLTWLRSATRVSLMWRRALLPLNRNPCRPPEQQRAMRDTTRNWPLPKAEASTPAQRFRNRKKAMDSARGQGANHSDASWHREDLQRRHRVEDALSCFEISVSAY